MFPYASVNLIADAARSQSPSFTSALCLDAMIGAPSLDGDGFGGIDESDGGRREGGGGGETSADDDVDLLLTEVSF